jgi:hypothetical protein
MLAFSTGRDARNDDTVAWVKGGDTGAELINDAQTFVPRGAAGRTAWRITFQDV